MRITVGDDAELCWLPEQLISVRDSELRVTTRAELAAGASLVLREEQVLGRTGEGPGRLTSRLTVRRAGRPLLDQELSCGPGAPGGWDGPAALAGHRAIGQLVVVRPEFEQEKPPPALLGEGRSGCRSPVPASSSPSSRRTRCACGAPSTRRCAL